MGIRVLKSRRFLGIHLALASALSVVLSMTGCDRGSHPSEIGRPAPDFTVADGSTSIHLAGYRGKVVVLNFWASWCAPCIQELPSLEQFHRDHPEYPILAVSIDEDADAYKRFLADRHVDFLTVRDPQENAANLYKTTGWPETFIIDRNGMVRRRFIGATDWSDPAIARFMKTL